MFHAANVFSAEYFWAAGYAVFYSLAALTLAAMIFSRKEL